MDDAAADRSEPATDPSATAATGPLAGLLVVDLTRALAGPHAAMMLGDMGARVIKVEAPGGDDTRSWGPPFVGAEGERESTYFMSANRNKESLVLDLRTDADREVLAALVESLRLRDNLPLSMITGRRKPLP